MKALPVVGDNFPMGCDPEGFVFKDSKPFHITGILGGSKDDPIVVGPEGAYQEDNVAFELNPTPSANVDELVNNTFKLLFKVKKTIKEHGLVTKIITSVEYPDGYKFPEQCQMAGCSPDYDIYHMKENPAPNLGNLRSAGGHMAMQLPRSVPLDKFVKMCDRTVGLYSVLKDRDVARRMVYGKAGCFRAHILNDDWGIIEYRTPSNFWLKSRKEMTKVFNLFQRVPGLIKHIRRFEDSYNEQYVVHAINNHRTDLARAILVSQGMEEYV